MVSSADGVDARREHPQMPDVVKFAVGVWHILGHIVDCQKKFGGRLLPGMALSFGDNVEHLWATIRRYNATTKYMSPAARSDFLHALVSPHVDPLL